MYFYIIDGIMILNMTREGFEMGDNELQVFADRLRELRKSLNLTQKEFADKIGITAAALSSYENNQINPSI